jgi:hypothetical protein
MSGYVVDLRPQIEANRVAAEAAEFRRSTGPDRAAVGTFPFPHRTVAEIYGPALENFRSRNTCIAQRRKG